MFPKIKPARKIRSALLMGFADEQIPLVEREIETLREIFTTAKSLTGAAATFAAYAENAPLFDILHPACHARFRADNPLFSSFHSADGFVTARGRIQTKRVDALCAVANNSNCVAP